MAAFDVQVQRLQDGARASQQAADQLERALTQLGRQEDAVVGSTWTGPAATTYIEGYKEWHQGATTTIEGLRAQARALHEAASRYQSTDTQSSSREAQAGQDLDSSRVRLNL